MARSHVKKDRETAFEKFKNYTKEAALSDLNNLDKYASDYFEKKQFLMSVIANKSD